MSRWPWLRLAMAALACGLLLACSSESSQDSARRLDQPVTLEVAFWTQLALPTAATARTYHGAVYEPTLESILLFGGRNGNDTGASLYDTGLVNGVAWSELSSTFAPRGYVRGVFDAARSKVVTYGGLNVALITGVTQYAETREFNASDSTWALRSSLSLPGRRSGYGLVYDSQRKVTVLFGGFDQSWKDDIYEWNGTTWTKVCAAAPCSTGPRPSPRALPVFVYDEARHVSLLFGGNGPEGPLGDTWSWDGARWRLLSTAIAPPPRYAAAATYDPVSQRTLLFGGASSDALETGDFWAWNGSEWSRIAQTTAPSNRRGAALVWDAKRGRGVLVGGSSRQRATDAWTFVISGNPCQTTSECHVGACLQGSCSAPADDGGMGGAGGEASDTGGTGGTGGTAGSGSLGGAAAAGTATVPAAGQASGNGGANAGGSIPTAVGGDDPTASSGGTTPSGANAGGPAAAPGRAQTPPSEDATAATRQSFYSCNVGRANPRRSSSMLLCIALSGAVAAATRKRRWRRALSGSASSPR